MKRNSFAQGFYFVFTWDTSCIYTKLFVVGNVETFTFIFLFIDAHANIPCCAENKLYQILAVLVPFSTEFIQMLMCYVELRNH